MDDVKTTSAPSDLASATDEARTYETIARAFKVVDIAQAVTVQVRPDSSVTDVWVAMMEDVDGPPAPPCEFCLVRDGERILGYLDFCDDLDADSEATASGLAHQIAPEMLVSAELPILDLVPLFRKHYFYFVLSRNDVTHVVSFQDLDRLPVKSCVFSLILELEDLLISAMRDDGAETFLSYLPPGRLNKARLLCRQKYEKVTSERLLHCTTFIDKKTMALGHEAVRKRLPFKSRREADRFFKKVEDTRNQIAHGELMLAKLDTPAEFDGLVRTISHTLAALR